MKIKKIITSLFVVAVIFTTGCSEEVYQDERMEDGTIKEKQVEFSTYTQALQDSGYNWYSEFLGDFVTSLKENGYRVSSSQIDEQINNLKVKIEEVEGIDEKKVAEMIDIKTKELSKNEVKDKEYLEKVEINKSNIPGNKNSLKEILLLINSGLELGKDNSFDEVDLNKISEIQLKVIEIYNNKIKLQSY